MGAGLPAIRQISKLPVECGSYYGRDVNNTHKLKDFMENKTSSVYGLSPWDKIHMSGCERYKKGLAFTQPFECDCGLEEAKSEYYTLIFLAQQLADALLVGVPRCDYIAFEPNYECPQLATYAGYGYDGFKCEEHKTVENYGGKAGLDLGFRPDWKEVSDLLATYKHLGCCVP